MAGDSVCADGCCVCVLAVCGVCGEGMRELERELVLNEAVALKSLGGPGPSLESIGCVIS